MTAACACEPLRKQPRKKLPEAACDLAAHPVLGPTTVSPTLVEVDTRSPNVTPAWARVLLDFRTATESFRSLVAFVDSVAHGAHAADVADAAGGAPHRVSDPWAAEPGTPPPDSPEPITGFYTPAEDERVVRARAALAAGMGREPALMCYRFATDGRFLTGLGAAIVGYSPGDEDQAHVAGESIAVDRMAESLRGHAALLREY